jgi:hypothetical protein
MRAVTLARRAVALVVVALAGAILWPGAAGASTPSNAAQAWYRQVVNDLHPLQSTLLGALDAASAWTSGSESAATARRELERDLPKLERVHRVLQDLAPLQGHASARNDSVAAIGLYVASLQVDEAATEEPGGTLQAQLQHSYERLRRLGDIVFDQGTAELAPELGATLAGPDVAAASHVPDWSSDGLAPAPPLASSWPPSGAPASGSQPKAEWAAEVAMDGAPAHAAVRAAAAGHARQSTLGPMVVALAAADVYVGSVPETAGDPLTANRLRLGLLVDAEALMSEEAAHLSHGVPARALAATAASVGAIGGTLRAES